MPRYRSPVFLFTILSAATVLMAPRTYADTIISGGNVINETWTPAGSPYIVQGDIIVPQNAFLTIEAGSVIQFASTDAQMSGIDSSRVELTVRGILNVAGTGSLPVVFEAQNSSGSQTWLALVLDSNSPSTIAYASIRDATWGLYILSGSHVIDAITITNSHDGIVTTVPTTVSNAIIDHVDEYGIWFQFQGGSATVINSTLIRNPTAIFTWFDVSTFLTNCIVTDNSTAFLIADGGTVHTTYSNIWNNSVTTQQSGSGHVVDDGGSISANPQYVSFPTDLHLRSSSVCIDAGTAIGAPDRDHDGDVRPFDGNGIPDTPSEFDMGAYEFGSSPTTTTTTTTTTSTTQPEDTGFIPPDNPSRLCEDAVTRTASRLGGAIFKCHSRSADAAFRALTFDEEGCEAAAEGKYDQRNTKLFAGGGCPPCVQSNALAMRLQLESMLDQANGLAYCAGSVPLP